jgi:hypothetical protein
MLKNYGFLYKLKTIIWDIKSIKCKLFGHILYGDLKIPKVCKCCHRWIGVKNEE